MRLFLTIFAAVSIYLATAQEMAETFQSPAPAVTEAPDYEADDGREYLNGMVPVAPFNSSLVAQDADSLHLPTLDDSGHIPSHYGWRHPFASGYWGWDLHEGLNVNLGLSAFVSSGKHGFSGTAERIAAMYAKPITDKLSIAVGGYFMNMNSGAGSFRTAGLSAIVDYRINEHWEAYLFAQKSLSNSFTSDPRHPLWLFGPYDEAADKIGAGLRYNFNNSTFVQVQFDFSSYPDHLYHNLGRRALMPGQSERP